MPWIWAALMPHPPILIHEVGQGREQEAAKSLGGVMALQDRLAAMPDRGRPDVLLILSPHQPYDSGRLFVNTAAEISGGMDRFGAPQIKFSLHTPLNDLRRLVEHLGRKGIPARSAEVDNLTPDHGTQVPLYFLAEDFTSLPAVILASPIGLSPEQAFDMGRALADFDTGNQKWALLASGDLSHRLTRNAPAGYNPEGEVFDQDIVESLASGKARSLIENWPESRLAEAGECGFRSVLALLGLADGPVEVLSYEGPFGVGYCNAFWAGQDGKEAAVRDGLAYPKLARFTVEKYLSGQKADDSWPLEIAGSSDLWSPQKACFVSIKTVDGDLRGCIGTILPVNDNLGREIMANAVSAATRDPRFPPMSKEELPGVVFSVDVLSPPEPVSSLEDLDPARWGVIVEKDGRRGVLLPDLGGVDTVEKQISIAANKAGISELRNLTIHRFSVTRYSEQGDGR